RNCFVNSVPDAQFPPPHEAVVAGRRRTIALRYVGPGRSRAQAPENPVQHLAIIHPWLAARLVRQQRLNDRPFKISDLVAASAHHISSFEELESHYPEPRYQFMSLRPSPDSVSIKQMEQIARKRPWKQGRSACMGVRFQFVNFFFLDHQNPDDGPQTLGYRSKSTRSASECVGRRPKPVEDRPAFQPA